MAHSYSPRQNEEEEVAYREYYAPQETKPDDDFDYDVWEKKIGKYIDEILFDQEDEPKTTEKTQASVSDNTDAINLYYAIKMLNLEIFEDEIPGNSSTTGNNDANLLANILSKQENCKNTKVTSSTPMPQRTLTTTIPVTLYVRTGGLPNIPDPIYSKATVTSCSPSTVNSHPRVISSIDPSIYTNLTIPGNPPFTQMIPSNLSFINLKKSTPKPPASEENYTLQKDLRSVFNYQTETNISSTMNYYNNPPNPSPMDYYYMQQNSQSLFMKSNASANILSSVGASTSTAVNSAYLEQTMVRSETPCGSVTEIYERSIFISQPVKVVRPPPGFPPLPNQKIERQCQACNWKDRYHCLQDVDGNIICPYCGTVYDIQMPSH